MSRTRRCPAAQATHSPAARPRRYRRGRPVRIRQPRDRHTTFEPAIIPKGQRRFEGSDEQIVAMYARAMTRATSRAHLVEIYGASVGRDTSSRLTAVLEDARAWQHRPLEAVYRFVYLDALIIKIRDGKAVENLACYLAIGVNRDGARDVLGMWFSRPRAPSSGPLCSPSSSSAACRTS